MKQLNEIYNELNTLMYNNFIFNNEHDYLYHYTDLDSAKSIIENSQFWVSDAFTTNDEKEIIHIKDLINDIVIEKYHNLEDEKKDIYLFAFDRACELLKINTFILCFSLSKNSKPLWNDYAKKDSKTGVCLRFDFDNITPNPIKEILSQNRYFIDVSGKSVKVKLLVFNHHVTYDYIEKRTKIEEYLELVTEILEHINLAYFDESQYTKEFDLLVQIFTDVMLYSFISKEASWKAEVEFRMVFIFPDIDKYNTIFKSRMRKAKEVKYVSLDMKSDNTFSLDRIFVNSKKDLKIAKRVLKNVVDSEIKFKLI